MKFITLSALILSVQANALVCVTDAQCLSKTLSLVKQARKNKVCSKEVEAIKSLGVVKLQTSLKSSELPTKLESCIAYAKEEIKFQKKSAKMQAKIEQTFAR
jgi:hypothetical protein